MKNSIPTLPPTLYQKQNKKQLLQAGITVGVRHKLLCLPLFSISTGSPPPSVYEGRANAFSVESPTPYIGPRLACWMIDRNHSWFESICLMKTHTLIRFGHSHWGPMHQPISICLFFFQNMCAHILLQRNHVPSPPTLTRFLGIELARLI